MRIYRDLEQRSDEWHRLRAGVATASNFDKLLTPTGKTSSQIDAYASQLVAEHMTGHTISLEQSAWMQRGTELEPEARAYYELERDAEVEEVGLILRDDGRVGCSPDGLVGDEGMVEIKCPAPHTHIDYLLSGELPGKYLAQVQGQLWIAERQWCDFISYHPDLPVLIVRAERDEEYIEALAAATEKLVATMDARLQTLAERGYIEEVA